jgi:hypothetical protein
MAVQYGRGCTVRPPMSQKFCATPKIGAYDFCSFETVDLVKVFQKHEGFFCKTFTKSTILKLQKSYALIFGVAQNF